MKRHLESAEDDFSRESTEVEMPVIASLSSRLAPQEGPTSSQGGPSMPPATGSAHSPGLEATVPGDTPAVSVTDVAPSSHTDKSKRSKGAVPLSSLAPPHPPTRALRLTGLVRPMMMSSLREMLQDRFGELDDSEGVKGGVWLDGIKSSGWIVFKDDTSAREVFEAFNGKPFPAADNFRTPVAFFYVPAEVVPRLIQEEQKYWEQERGRMEIVASLTRPGEGHDGESEATYEYFARPFKQQKKIREPKPPPTSATAAAQSGVSGSGQGISIRGSGGFNKRAGPAGVSNGVTTAGETIPDGSALPPISFPPDRSSRGEQPQRSVEDRRGGDGDGGRGGETRRDPPPRPSSSQDQDRYALTSSTDYANVASSPSAPTRDAQTELEMSRSRDAAASAYAGRGGRARSDLKRDDYYSAVDRSGAGYDWEPPGGRAYGRGNSGAGYGDRGDYDRFEEPHDWERRRTYNKRDLPVHPPEVALAARDDRSWPSRANGGGGIASGRFDASRERNAVRGSSPGWMGDRAPVPVAVDADSHGYRQKEWFDRPTSTSNRGGGNELTGASHRGDGGIRGGVKRGTDEREWERERSTRAPGKANWEEDRYASRRREERN